MTLLSWAICLVALFGSASATEPFGKSVESPKKTQRLLLIGQSPDGHPYSTHEFMAATNLLAKLLSKTPSLQTVVVKADGKWVDGPELLDGADAALIFLGEGAKWIQQDEARLRAFQQLAARGGGLAVLHWGMGTKDAKNIDAFVNLFGACHGGPDRKYKVAKFRSLIANSNHPIVNGVAPFDVEDEFYYALKLAQRSESITPLIQISVDGKNQAVGWAWQRSDGGRSFGFSGCHFHRNWELESYRRLVTQGVLWTLGRSIPEAGINVDVAGDDLELAPRQK